jgi:hypothetical protein
MENFARVLAVFPRQICGAGGEAALFVFALLILALGALSLVDEIWWRRNARRVTAEILGARLHEGRHYAVYKFAGAGGLPVEVTSCRARKHPPRRKAKDLLVMAPEEANFRPRRSFIKRFIVCSLLLIPWAWFAVADIAACGAAPWKPGFILLLLAAAVPALRRATRPPPDRHAALREKLKRLPIS